MENRNNYQGGENFNLRDMLLQGRKLTFKQRSEYFSAFIDSLVKNKQGLYMRVVDSPSDREVEIIDPYTNKHKKMLMFGSNNYLGLANHPFVREQVRNVINSFGVGIGGPPLLNGYTSLHAELEELLADFKGKESCLIFSSGYGANIGIVTGLMNSNDMVIYDEYSHASFCDGIKMGKVNSCSFRHNDMTGLEELLKIHSQNKKGDIFVGVEGVYSMDGDLAPLDIVSGLCKKYGVYLILDDAHGTGVMGECGRGTAHYFGVADSVDVLMGTFSKAFGVTGGFVCASKPVIDYLRFMARPYMFSASMPPVIVAAIKAGLEVILEEPELINKLHSNVNYAVKKLNSLGFNIETPSPIIAIRVPETMNIRNAVYHFHELGIFLNSIEYPAVPLNQQRFRVSISASHTEQDIDELAYSFETVWRKFNNKTSLKFLSDMNDLNANSGYAQKSAEHVYKVL